MRTAIAGALVALLVGLTASTAHAAIAPATYEKQMLDRTNVVRAEKDRARLTVQACLDSYANAWAKHLATVKKSLTHRSTASLKLIMKNCKLDGIGENLAFNYASGTATVNAWVKSPGHSANQLGAGYRYVGVGAHVDAKGRYYAVAMYGNPA